MFTVSGKPEGKGRPIFNSHTKSARTPEKTVIYENHVRYSFMTSKDYRKYDGCVKASIVAYYPIPIKTSKKNRAAMLEGKIRPTVKPDLDNIIKAILDSLNSVAYNDDAAIVELSSKKYYSEDPRVEVTLEEIE